MAASTGEGGDLQTLIGVLQNVVIGIGNLVRAVSTVFPQGKGTASSANGGSATLPAQPVGFLIITLPDGTTGKVPYYS